jgi:UDP-hydrolysing UDP-N-acetyl-D-glucosamine 2-epimerase
MKRNICVFISNRANYSSIKCVLQKIKINKKLNLQLILGSGAILDKYGHVSTLIKKDGFNSNFELNILVQGSTPETMTKTAGLALIELSTIIKKIKPDIAIVVGDRYENMSFAMAAAYMNIKIIHTMGGEVSGTIDESIRHAITKFSHIHFTASKDAYQRVIKMGENPKNVFQVGCPRIDLVKQVLKKKINLSNIFESGVGEKFDINKPFLIVSQHPVTTEYKYANQQILETLKALNKTNLPAIVLWPNPDAGSEDIARGIRRWRELGLAKKMHFFKNIEIEKYIHLLNKTVCLVGNSSSGIREGAFIGVPVVNIGTRQNKRLRGKNVIDVNCNHKDIFRAILKQIKIKKYKKENIYGSGNASKKIVDILIKKIERIPVQKEISY